ncbi:MAG: XrtA/PEP-CTERM system histidine kinase PrsK [Pseudomonadota bacterium]
MIEDVVLIGLIGYGASALAFLALTVILLVSGRHGVQGFLMLAACFATAAWSAAEAYQIAYSGGMGTLASLLDAVCALLWVAFLSSLVQSDLRQRLASPWLRAGLGLVGLLVGAWLATEALQPWSDDLNFKCQVLAHLVVVVLGLILAESLLRNTPTEDRWRIKFLCIGLGGVLVFDLFYFADALLFSETSAALTVARGYVYALIMPLLAVSSHRNAMWRTNVTFSRTSALYTTALTASGVYLSLMAAAAYYVREVGGTWGAVIQAVFLFGAAVVLALLLLSGAFRAHLRVFVSKHFFQYRYDYRTVWLRFTDTVSGSETAQALPGRVVNAIADILDSPGGAMWLRDRDNCVLASAWNMSARSLSAAEAADFLDFLGRTGWIIDLDEQKARPEKYENLVIPEVIARIGDAWVIVPLRHRDAVLGFVILARPRAPRPLGWEDFDLLKTISRHAASYLAEQQLGRALAEAREFEKLNRRFAFVLHDIKNLASQISLLASNFERHGENPDFRADMVTTLKDASSQMKRLMERLKTDQIMEPEQDLVWLKPLMRQLMALESGSSVLLDIKLDAEDVAVSCDQDRLAAVLRHLVQNAKEAVGDGGLVQISLGMQGNRAVIEIIDDGCGMEEEFVHSELFKPFRSTKKVGYGLGAYQCREFARELGGDIEVISSIGAGTTMRVIMPIAKTRAPERSLQVVAD